MNFTTRIRRSRAAHCCRGMAVAGSMLLPARVAQAQFIDGRAIATGASVISFDGLGLTNYQAVPTVFGVSFSNAYFAESGIFGNNFSTGAAYNVPPTGFTFGVLSIRFGTAVGNAAFNVLTNLGTTTFTAYLNGSVVQTAARQTSPAGSMRFYGFESIIFDRIDVETTIANTTGDAFAGIDNLYFGTVAAAIVTPEPASRALLLAGLMALAAFARFRVVSRR